MVKREARTLHTFSRLVACMLCLLPAILFAQLADDPASLPLPDFHLESYERGIALIVNFPDGGLPVVEEVLITRRRAPASVANPPLLRIELYDGSGQMLSMQHDWDPLLERNIDDSGHESQRILPTTRTTFFLPLKKELAEIKIFDDKSGSELISEDVETLVTEYCDTHKDLPACGGSLPTPTPTPTPVPPSPSPSVSPSPSLSPSPSPEASPAVSPTPSATPDDDLCKENVNSLSDIIKRLARQIRRLRFGKLPRKKRKGITASLAAVDEILEKDVFSSSETDAFAVKTSKSVKLIVRLAKKGQSSQKNRFKKGQKRARKKLNKLRDRYESDCS